MRHRNCTENDYNWGTHSQSDEDSNFFQLNIHSRVDVEIFGHRLKCLEEDISMFGHYDSSATQNLMVAFMSCDPKSRNDCKSEDEISEWLSNKYIITLVNEKRFLHHIFNGPERYI